MPEGVTPLFFPTFATLRNGSVPGFPKCATGFPGAVGSGLTDDEVFFASSL